MPVSYAREQNMALRLLNYQTGQFQMVGLVKEKPIDLAEHDIVRDPRVYHFSLNNGVRVIIAAVIKDPVAQFYAYSCFFQNA
jgi:hypothetical protein